MRWHHSRMGSRRQSRTSAALLAALLATSSCAAESTASGPTDPTQSSTTTEATVAPSSTSTSAPTTTTTTVPLVRVRTGADVLAADDFARLAGKRVGAIANPTSRVGNDRLIDRLAEHPDVTLAAIFAPEHGVTGTADAGEVFDNSTDDATAVTVHSLYGADRSPTPEALEGLDVLVYDLQDVGTRFYTYISTMGLAMQAAAAADVEFMVLDRPNPLGGDYVAGFVREPEQDSFIGQYPIPAAYGMTAGELAQAIVGEQWLTGLDELRLTIVTMEGWLRTDRWPDTGLAWVAPSPGLPTFDSAATYPGTVLLEATSLSYGTGTRYPFHTVGTPWTDARAQDLAAGLEARSIPGVEFAAARYVPEVRDIAPNPRLEGHRIEGVRMTVTDPAEFDPVGAGVHLIEHFQTYGQSLEEDDIISRPTTFALLAGTRRVQTMLAGGEPAASVIQAWADDVAAFRALRQPYLLYD